MFVCVCILEQRDFDMFPCSRSEQQHSPATDGHTWSLQSTFACVCVHPRTSVHHQPWPLWSDTTLGLIVPPNSLSGARWQPAPSFIPLLALSFPFSLLPELLLQYPFSHPPHRYRPRLGPCHSLLTSLWWLHWSLLSKDKLFDSLSFYEFSPEV